MECGALQTFGATGLANIYLSDIATPMGRQRNYPGELRDAAPGQDCWLAVGDPNRCPDSPDNMRIEIDREAIQVTQGYTHVKCLTAQ